MAKTPESEEAELSEYEKLRLNHMQRNHEMLVSLGLKRAEDPIAPNHCVPPKAKRPRHQPPKTRHLVPPSSLRRSSRLAGKAAEVGAEVLTGMDETEEAALERQVDHRGPASSSSSSSASAREAMRESAMAYLRAVREAVLPVMYADDWQREAVRRWGDKCVAGSGDWRKFVESRLSTPPPLSPLDFLQEYYASDVWRLLVCCVLMSRVSSWHTKHVCISAFFETYATPTAFANETDWSRVKQAIHSLGLFDDRLRSLVALTDHFLRGAVVSPDDNSEVRDDAFQLSTDRGSPYKVHGVGPFGVESYRVFCKDEGATIALSAGGKPIAPFVAWRKKLALQEENGNAKSETSPSSASSE